MLRALIGLAPTGKVWALLTVRAAPTAVITAAPVCTATITADPKITARFSDEVTGMIETLTRGDTRTLPVVVYQPGSTTVVQDISAASAIKFTMRKGSPAGVQVAQKTLASGIIVTDAAKGELQISLAPSDTSSLPSVPTQVAYDLEITWINGKVDTVAIGILTVRPDVTV
jgi:hypothetical protein